METKRNVMQIERTRKRLTFCTLASTGSGGGRVAGNKKHGIIKENNYTKIYMCEYIYIYVCICIVLLEFMQLGSKLSKYMERAQKKTRWQRCVGHFVQISCLHFFF